MERISILRKGVAKHLLEQGFGIDDIEIVVRCHLKYQGTDSSLPVRFQGIKETSNEFQKTHKDHFGFIMEDRDLVIETLEVEGICGNRENCGSPGSGKNDASNEIGTRSIHSGSKWKDWKVLTRDSMLKGQKLNGPALISEDTATTVLEEGWSAEVGSEFELILTRTQPVERMEAPGTEADPIRLEIFNRMFMSIAEQMGYSLQNTSYSVNIKERLDFSCAIFDGNGGLVANAPHIPVHLGSMSQAVNRWLSDTSGNIEKGDVYLVNSPYHGGTHLPDITVITPVFQGDGEPSFFVASRGHHSDIGGKTPGSMPPDSKNIEEEGVLSSGMKIVERGTFQEEDLMEWLKGGRYPARDPYQNIADLKAQIAANVKGSSELKKLMGKYGRETVLAYMGHVQDNAERSVRNVLGSLKEGSSELLMDQDSRIRLSVKLDTEEEKAIIDLEGTSPRLDSNFNAPSAVCTAAILYSFRTLVNRDIPLNKGCLIPLDIRIPEGSMLDPVPPSAVAAGNVETSMFITDAVFEALGILAGSQGTMNNLTFGNERCQYYETICGGTGAGDGFNGTDAVHSHMTNTRITDPEILEARYPVILEEFSIRKGSGGKGKYHGGDGVIRRIRFLEEMMVSILSQHRKVPPKGLMGGEDGKTGRNMMMRADNGEEELPGCMSVDVSPGDRIQIETPGGGGFGETKDP